jgi:hypothetical protein
MTDKTIPDHLGRERLRRRLIRGVVLSAISFAVTILQIGKKWNEYHTFGLIFGIVMLVAVLIHASSLKRGANH